jgi:hypothetical protein
MSKDQWLSVIECHLCKSYITSKEAYITLVDYEYFGTKGNMFVDICKECHRENKLKELGV